MRRVAVASALAVLAFAGAAQGRPPVWVVRDADSELVLFGSMHVLPPGIDWRPPALTRALAGADDVWFELPIDGASQSQSAEAAQALGVLPPNQRLSSLLPPRTAAQLARIAKAYRVDPVGIDRLRPWLAEVVLAGAVYRQAGAGQADGVEQALAAEAPASVQRRAFETAREQVALLAGTPLADQTASLAETLDSMEHDPGEFVRLLKAWQAGDLAQLDRGALQPMRKAAPALFRRLVTDRNARWTSVLDARLKGRGRTVVVVGMGHLIGPGGVPARLRALGYKVEGP